MQIFSSSIICVTFIICVYLRLVFIFMQYGIQPNKPSIQKAVFLLKASSDYVEIVCLFNVTAPSFSIFCTNWSDTAVHCNAVQYTALNCRLQQCTALHCTAQHYITLHCTMVKVYHWLSWSSKSCVLMATVRSHFTPGVQIIGIHGTQTDCQTNRQTDRQTVRVAEP